MVQFVSAVEVNEQCIRTSVNVGGTFFDAKKKFEWLIGLFADGKGDILELTSRIRDL